LTEVAIRSNGNSVATLDGTTPTMASLAEWAGEVRAAAQIAEGLCRTSFVPKHFYDKPAETAAAILTGYELGLSPMAAVRSIFIISGTPGMYAKSMVAVVQSRGHEVWIPEQSDERVVVRGRRKGSKHVFETVWDRARVVKAKLTGNAKYQDNPQQMMVARGQAEICRQVAADALHGIPYAVEELDDFPDASPAPAVGRVTATEILSSAVDETPAPAPLTSPSSDPARHASERESSAPPDSNVAAQGQAEPGITTQQSKKMYALLRETGREDRDVALVYISGVIDRVVESTKELTKREAGKVIDALEAPAEPDLDEDTP
jgi:hypothetical protein